MADRATVYKRFNKAITGYVAASAALVTFTGHTSGAPKIFVRTNGDEAQVPSVTLGVFHGGALLAEVDDGIMETLVQLDAWSDDKNTSMDALGVIESLFMQNANTQQDAAFDSDGIKTVGIMPMQPLRVGEEDATESNVFVSTAMVKIRWIDNQA